MYNEKVAEILRKEYGDEKFIIYCEMEATVKEHLTAEIRNIQGYDPTDSDYDAFWWRKKYEELKQNLTNERVI